jgi:hypothetical protein
MAKKKSKKDDLFDTLRASGLRKRVADTLSTADSRSKQGRKLAESAISDLRSAADQIEDKFTGRSKKQRQAAAEKAAATRKRNAAKRSQAAKKGAKTRAKSGAKTRAKSSS